MKLVQYPATFQLDLQGTPAEHVLTIMEAALRAANPAEAVRRNVVLEGTTLYVGSTTYDLRQYEHIYVVGAGKASAAMAHTRRTNHRRLDQC